MSVEKWIKDREIVECGEGVKKRKFGHLRGETEGNIVKNHDQQSHHVRLRRQNVVKCVASR